MASPFVKQDTSGLIGTAVPAVKLDLEFGKAGDFDLAARCADKKVILVGLPGAFTPTWSTCQVPGYKSQQQVLAEKGIDEVIVFCVNDAAVMAAWAKDQGIDSKGIITFVGDTQGALTKALGMEMTHPGPCGVLGAGRCKRFSAYIEEGTIKVFNLAEGEGDPAGDDKPEFSCVEQILTDLEDIL